MKTIWTRFIHICCDVCSRNPMFFKNDIYISWLIQGTIILINICVLDDKNKKFNKFIIKILYTSIFFCNFARQICEY